jgi:chemotaxis protein methyltransferase CheR
MDKAPKGAALEREFAFSVTEFKRICELIYERAGIHLTQSKKDMVYSRLARRLRANNISSFSDYLQIIEANNDPEREAFVNALTTNVTSFYREAHHFEILAEHIKNLPKQRFINIWCNAASTGQEPYTIAMTMMDLFDGVTPPVNIIATDIDTNALQKASAGVYTMEEAKNLPKDVLERHFLKGRAGKTGSIKIRQELRDMVSFAQLNLLDAQWPIKGSFDAIFCRNVMIYFDKATQNNILRRFIPMMQRDALMFAGHSESLQGLNDMFQLRGKTVYSLTEKYQSLSSSAVSK